MKKMIFLVVLLFCARAFAHQVKYKIKINDSLEELESSVCFYGFKPKVLESTLSDANNYISSHSDNIEVRRSRLALKLDARPCVNFTLDIKSIQTLKKFHRTRITRNSKIIHLPTGYWIWRPAYYPEDTVFTLELELPDGSNALLPWSRNDSGVYYLNKYPSFLSIDTYIGHFDVQQFHIGRSLFQVAFLFDTKTKEKLLRWLQTAASAVEKVYGEFPTPQVNIALHNVNRPTAEATPFALVTRGEGTLIQFLVNPLAAEKDFIMDWTAYHELAHLLIPFVDRKSAWMSEGLSSYYQYLIMGKAGVIDENEVFQQLWQGIKRGNSNHYLTRHMSLESATYQMRNLKSYRRVYWTGALLWMTADLTLRERGSSLDQLLLNFKDCCYERKAFWNSSALAKQLDLLLDAPLFVPLFNNAKPSTEFPDYQELFRKLGLGIENNELQFFPSKLRKELVSPAKTNNPQRTMLE